jgi:predicted kinase
VLIVVAGPPGSGKTTLAHEIAAAVGCPAICRDEIKQGMAHTVDGFIAGPGDELTVRTFPVFFGVLDLLIRARVSTVAEAAFQNRAWRRGLEPLADLADLRIVHCTVDADVAFRRSLRRSKDSPLRSVHPDPSPGDRAEWTRRHGAFERLTLDVPSIEVDTTSGYRPTLPEVIAFAAGRR